MRLAVIGAGVVGVTTAYELTEDGHEVTVFERHNTAAEGASFANGGLIAPEWIATCVQPLETKLKLVLPDVRVHIPSESIGSRLPALR